MSTAMDQLRKIAIDDLAGWQKVIANQSKTNGVSMAATKKSTRKTSKKNKVKKQLSHNVDLMLDGAVYIVEYDDQGKIVSKAELDGEAVLKALLYVLTKASKAKPKKP